MKSNHLPIVVLGLLALVIIAFASLERGDPRQQVPSDREEVVFWHFWGGDDRKVVEHVVDRFNDSQSKYFVRAIAMPGNNLDVKLFLAVTGGDPPDVINQDDPIVADWAHRGALTPIDELASAGKLKQLNEWLFPAARRLCEYDGRLYGLCNGLDIRALYYNKTLLDEHPELNPPRTSDDLTKIAERLSVVDSDGRQQRFGYLPDSRRLWAWGVVFGGDFFDPAEGVTANDKSIVAALEWMQSFSKRYGAEKVAAFRQGDQSLPGKTFPLLPVSDDSPHGRYAVIMDGQWRVRDITRSQMSRRMAGLPTAEYGVCPLPHPPGGRSNAGWVNGNFFLVPRGAKNPQGAWEFMKFWSGFDGHEAQAARTCRAGGWVPVSQAVVEQESFREYLDEQPLFRTFVELAASPNQFPIPVIPGAPFFNREIKNVGGAAMADADSSASALLEEATEQIQKQLDRTKR